MKAYLINLDRSKDRLAHMSKLFNEMGVEFERVPAVHGRGLSAAELDDLIVQDRKWAEPITADEVGCFLSHRRCLEAIASGKDDFAIVCEDDVSFAPNAAELLSTTTWFPSDADIIKLETNGAKVLLGAPASVCDHGLPIVVAPLLSAHILSAGYIVSRRAAAKIVKSMDRIAEPLDHFLFDPAYGVFGETVIYQSIPAICRQADWASTIQKGRSLIQKNRSVLTLLSREISRSWRRSRTGLRGLWANCFTDKSWGPVPFDPNL